MAQTSYRNDDARIKKELEMSTFQGRYFLSTPGQGMLLPFVSDPHIRLQSFGANMMSDMHGIENDLMGRNRVLKKYPIDYKALQPTLSILPTKTNNKQTFNSRSELPAWLLRDRDNQLNNFQYPWINPQDNIEFQGHYNIQTRLLDKKQFMK